MVARYGLLNTDSAERDGHGLSRAVEKCLTEPLQLLLGEFDQTLGFLGSRYPRQPVARCLLIGGGAAILHLDRWLAQQTNVPAQSWQLPLGRACQVDVTLLPTPIFAHAAALSALAFES